MRLLKLVFLIVLVISIWDTGFLCASTLDETLPPQIVNLNTDTVLYCSDSILVAEQIYVLNVEIDGADDGMKISIANYKKGEDILVWSPVGSLTYEWKDNYGYLEIKGAGTSAEYQSAVRKVYYKNLANVPSLEPRSFSISLLDADYLPHTEHFYRYVSALDITWTEARDSAAKMNYYGLQGYLATIRSSAENDFIWTKIDGVGWIGASDEEKEGTWKWVTGPDSGIVFWQGNQYGSAVGGEYSFWNNGEPNNVGTGEHYAHVNYNPSTIDKSWNDLPNATNPSSNYYRARGFIVEFGDMKDDPEVKLSATATIKVGKIAFSDEREFEICEGDEQQLNLSASNKYSYSWSPAENINSTSVSNPVVSPIETKTYVATGKLDACTQSANFIVKVNPAPKTGWELPEIICQGASIELNPGTHSSYLWANGETAQTITVSEEGWYSVKLSNDKNCRSKDSIEVKWAEIPILDYSLVDTLVCGSKEQKLNLSFEGVSASTTLIPLQTKAQVANETTLNPQITVDEYGIFSFKMDMVDVHTCRFSDTLNIEFHNQPTAQFQIDEAECEGYNLKLFYKGETNEAAVFDWYSSDTLYQTGVNLDTMEIPLGYGTFERTVGLRVNEQGCIDSLVLPVTVTPILDFWTDKTEGCTPLDVNFDYAVTEPIDSFYWNLGDGTETLIDKPKHQYTNPGISDLNFDVALKIVSAEGCENEGILKDLITVHPIPTIDLSFAEDECYSDTAKIWYIGSGTVDDKYYWDLNNLDKDEVLNNPRNSPGPLNITGSKPEVKIGVRIVSQYGCKTDTLSKTLKRKPAFDVLLDNNKNCPSLNVGFSAFTLNEHDEVTYLWDFGDGNTGLGDTVSNQYFEAGKNYDIQIIANSSLTGCSDTLLLRDEVSVFPVPKALFNANPPSVLISNPVIEFENRSEAATEYLWDFGDETIFNSEDSPAHRFPKMGFYDVTLKAYNEFGCFDTTSQQVSVAFDKLFPPTVFSPNANLKEDTEFRIYSAGISDSGYHLILFNRWGEKIFESSSQLIGWDGKMRNGNFAPAGVYTWVVRYLDFRGEEFKQQGTVTLLF